MPEIHIDRQALKEILTSLKKPGGENEWCIACGAGAASSKLDYPPDLVSEAGKQFLDPKSIREFLSAVRSDLGEQDWCIGCGAAAAASPLTKVLPAEVSDAFIDELARKLLGAVKLG